jgi:hypothetical protein
MDWRIWLFLVISLVFWFLNMSNHREPGRYNKIKVSKILAWVAGSPDQYVDWRSLSFQLGFAVFFLSQWILIKEGVENFTLYGGALTMTTILVVQGVIKLLYKDDHLE